MNHGGLTVLTTAGSEHPLSASSPLPHTFFRDNGIAPRRQHVELRNWVHPAEQRRDPRLWRSQTVSLNTVSTQRCTADIDGVETPC